MTLNINGYTVEIKAKDSYSNRFNQDDTKAFINLLSSMASQAAEEMQHKGYDSLQKQYDNIAIETHDFLDNLGYYDAIRKQYNW